MSIDFTTGLQAKQNKQGFIAEALQFSLSFKIQKKIKNTDNVATHLKGTFSVIYVIILAWTFLLSGCSTNNYIEQNSNQALKEQKKEDSLNALNFYQNSKGKVIQKNTLTKELGIEWPLILSATKPKENQFQIHDQIQDQQKNNQPRKTDNNAINIGVLAPFEGSAGILGRSLVQGIKLALLEDEQIKDARATKSTTYNKNRQYKDHQVNEITEKFANNIRITALETGLTTSSIKNTIEKIEDYEFDIIVGPLISNQATILYDYIEKNSPSTIAIITFTNDLRLKNQKNLFVFGMSAENQLEHILKNWITTNEQHYSSINSNNRDLLHGDLLHNSNNFNYLYAVLPQNNQKKEHIGSKITKFLKVGKNSPSATTPTIEQSISIEENIPKNIEGEYYALKIKNTNLITKIYHYDEENLQNVAKEINLITQDIENNLIEKKLSSCENIGILVTENDWKLKKIYHHIRSSRKLANCNIKVIGLGKWNEENKKTINNAVFGDYENEAYKAFLNDFTAKYDITNFQPIAAISYDIFQFIKANLTAILQYKRNYRSNNFDSTNHLETSNTLNQHQEELAASFDSLAAEFIEKSNDQKSIAIMFDDIFSNKEFQGAYGKTIILDDNTVLRSVPIIDKNKILSHSLSYNNINDSIDDITAK